MNILFLWHLNRDTCVVKRSVRLSVALLTIAVVAASVRADDKPFNDFFPYGVYASGGDPVGSLTGKDGMAATGNSFERACKDLAAHNMNCVWPNNLPWDLLPLWLEAAGNNGIRVIPQAGGPPGLIRPKSFADKKDMLAQTELLYRELADKYKNSHVLLAWSAVEEVYPPVDWFYEGLAELTKKMAQWDPNHPMITLDNRATSAWVNATTIKPKALCNDVYPFFGDGISGPYRLIGSQDLFRRNCRLFREAAELAGSRFWIMGQGVHEDMYIDGVKAYPTYRYPTPNEIRWQVWAAIQEGAKGFLFYYYQNRQLRPNSIVDRGLRDIDGSETEQFRMASEVGSQIKFLMPLLVKLQVATPHETAVYWDNGPVSSQTHIDRKTRRRFIIVVNNDCENIQPINMELGYWPGFIKADEKVFDLRTRRAYDYSTIKITTLQPGDGTVLLIATDKQWEQFSKEFFGK